MQNKMLKAFINRENEIFDILKQLVKKDLNFILIGGYAVSAFKHRFSVDADIVIDKDNLEELQKILKDKKFELFNKKDISYKGKFESYKIKKKLTITIDLLIGGVACRQTDGFWDYEEFKENSIDIKLKGIEEEVSLKVPSKELLIAIKIHSGRLTDIRDIVALFENVNNEKIIQFIKRGKIELLLENIKKMVEIVKSENFKDSFKGVFSLEKLPDTNISDLINFLKIVEKELT